MNDVETTDEGRWRWTNRADPPSDDLLPESHQVWVWLTGPNGAHWAIRGTGVKL